ncbi:MAG: TetR family transcriptional regulator [Spirochaetota bacterium]
MRNSGIEHEKPSAATRDRILEVARELFARKGFAGNGIRDIARAAGVSVSMVSYHFSGKLGVLRAIMTAFFDDYTQVVEAALREETDLESRVVRLVGETTMFLKFRQDDFRIVVTELPRVSDETGEFERRYLHLIRGLTDELLIPEISASARERGCIDAEELHRIVGPALLSMVYSTFLFGRGLELAYCFERDEAFFAEYTSLVSRLILAGVREVASPPPAEQPGQGANGPSVE